MDGAEMMYRVYVEKVSEEAGAREICTIGTTRAEPEHLLMLKHQGRLESTMTVMMKGIGKVAIPVWAFSVLQ